MGSVTVEAKFMNISLDQLHDELTRLKLAGYGMSTVDFRTPSTGFCTAVTLKMFKPLDAATP